MHVERQKQTDRHAYDNTPLQYQRQSNDRDILPDNSIGVHIRLRQLVILTHLLLASSSTTVLHRYAL